MIGGSSELSSRISGETESQFRIPEGVPDITFEDNPAFLVVDDDPVNIRILQNYLESRNCIVKTASDGLCALDIIKDDDSIDLVLLDIMMPGMSGYEVCKRIRMIHSPEELPVVMLTAKNLASDINAAFEAGANDYITKPFQVSELLVRVNVMLRLKNINKNAATGISLGGKTNYYFFEFADITHISSRARKVIVYTKEREVEIPVSMKEILEKIPGDMFVRIHKQHIVNIQHVGKLTHILSGRYRLLLIDHKNTELPIGAAFLDTFRKKIQ